MLKEQDDVYEIVQQLKSKIAELESTLSAMSAELRIAQQQRWAGDK